MSMTTTTDGGDSMRRSAARNPRRRVRDATSNSPSQPRRKRSRYHEVEPAAAVDTTESIRSGLNALAVQSSASFSRTADAARHKRPPKTDNAHLLVRRCLFPYLARSSLTERCLPGPDRALQCAPSPQHSRHPPQQRQRYMVHRQSLTFDHSF